MAGVPARLESGLERTRSVGDIEFERGEKLVEEDELHV